MNSTYEFSLERICNFSTHYILKLKLNKETKTIFFSNVKDFNSEYQLYGVEIDNFVFANLESKEFNLRRNDFTIYGKCDIICMGIFKISFAIEGVYCNGKYILLRPGWASNSKNKVWILIPSKK